MHSRFFKRVAKLLNTSPESWLRMQQAVDLWEVTQQPEKLAGIKLKLERNRLTTPLFDTTSYARHLEALYAQMHARSRAGLPLEHLSAA